jgi:hypothetical protein
MPDSGMNAMMEEQNARHYCAVGRVAIAWTRLVSYLSETVRMLAGFDNELGECITAQIASVDRLIDALSALSDLRCPGMANERSFRERINLFQSLADRRNRTVNDLWTFDPGITNRWPTTVGRTLQQGPIPMTTLEVDALAQEIERFSDTFLGFRRELLMSLNLWQGQ